MSSAPAENQLSQEEIDRRLHHIAVNGTLEQRTHLICRLAIDHIALTGDVVTALQWLYDFSAINLAALVERSEQTALH